MVYIICRYLIVIRRMATANPISEDNFVLELNRVKESIVTKFREISELLDERKNELLRQINAILVSYQTYKQEFQTTSEKKKDLEKTKLLLQSQFTNSPIKSVHDNFIVQINTELEAIETPKQPKLFSFVCDKQKLLTEVNKLCKLVERVSEIDYTSKTQSIISVCDRGTGNEQLNNPHGITVDHDTDNIYVTDYSNHCVKVFDNTTKYLYKFGDESGEGKMSNPIGLLIRNNTVFVSHNHCILVYQLDGKFVSSIGGEGSGKLQFNCPWGLSANESNNDIYICDSNNHRIQIIFQDLQFKSNFGKDTLRYPCDVKLTQQHIYVLDESNPCIHVYNYNHVLIKSMISRGEGNQIIHSVSFFIDRSDNILITDRLSNTISIFNSNSEIIHKINVFSSPTGIVVDNQDRIIVVRHASKNCLQIF